MNNKPRVKDELVVSRLEKLEDKLDELITLRTQYSRCDVSADSDDMGVREIIGLLWEGKGLIVTSVITFTVFAVFYAISLPNVYRSETLLAPSSEGAVSGLNGVSRQFGGVMSLAGLKIGGTDTDKSIVALEVLQSRKFLAKFIARHELMVPLIAVAGWNESTNQLFVDEDVYDNRNNQWLLKTQDESYIEPSIWDGVKKLKKLITVAEDEDSGLVTVSIDYLSPFVAKDWLEKLVFDLNQEMKNKDVNEALRSIEFLKAQMERTSVANMQAVFYDLIEEQTKTIMLAEVREGYSFSIIDPPIVPEEKFKPSRFVWVLAGAVFGGFVGALIVILMAIRRTFIE